MVPNTRNLKKLKLTQINSYLTNIPSSYNPAIHLRPFGKSNHQCFSANPQKQKKMKAISLKVRKMHPGNIAELTICLNKCHWDEVLNA